MWHPVSPRPVCVGGRKHAALHSGLARHELQHSSCVPSGANPMSRPCSPAPRTHVQLPGGAGGAGGAGGDGGCGCGCGDGDTAADVRTTSVLPCGSNLAENRPSVTFVSPTRATTSRAAQDRVLPPPTLHDPGGYWKHRRRTHESQRRRRREFPMKQRGVSKKKDLEVTSVCV
jgi:hypothetical protein